MLVLTGPNVEGTAGHSQHVNDWTTPPFPPPHPTHLATIPSSQNRDATLFLPSDNTTSLLPDIDYFALSELDPTTTSKWPSSNFTALNTFEKTFGSYVYPQ